MNISYNWLRELVDFDLPVEVLAKKLTSVGLAVEGIHAAGDDFIFDIDLTSNRPDCLSHLGIAREVAAVTGSKLKATDVQVTTIGEMAGATSQNHPLVIIEDADLCHRFTARIIRDVKVGPSPEWLVRRLESIGERSINNVADVTNYVMHELGQPMHAFDLDKLVGNRIVVRRGRTGESITTLEEVERKLDESMLAICDAEKPVAIAGIMGGASSGIGDSTTNVLLEVAYFKRENIRQTSRKLTLSTEASYRFERGVDIENLTRASNRATDLVCQLAGGRPAEFVDVYPTPRAPVEVISSNISTATKRLTGLAISNVECHRVLNSLGIRKEEGVDRYVSPSWRYDIAIEEDLVEEVARLSGYDSITDELPPAFGAGEYQASETRKKLLRRALVDLGFDEAISYSFIDTSFDGVFELVPQLVDERCEEKFVTLQDSVIEGATRMRPSLLPGLLEAIRLNLNHQRRNLRLFEIGRVFAQAASEHGLPIEREQFALAITGAEIIEGKAAPIRELDFYDAKGAVEAALDAVGSGHAQFTAADVKHLRRGQAAAVSVAGETVGFIGRLSEDISAAYKFKQPVFLAEIDLQKILRLEPATVAYRPLPKYPGIVRDVSLLTRRDVSFADIQRAIEEQRFELVRGVQYVDTFEGKGVEEGSRSLTIRLEFRSDERTLVESEIEELNRRIIGSLEEQLGIRQRF